MQQPIDLLLQLYEKTFHAPATGFEPLPVSGSKRQYFRILGKKHTVIGTYNDNPKENQAFVYMSQFFKKHGLNVPQIFAYEPNQNIYLQQDLGNQTLLHLIQVYPQNRADYYRKVLQHLLKFQTCVQGFDWSQTYPVPEFDQVAYMFDLNYFKYMVLKLNNIVFDELRLHEQLLTLVDFVLQSPHEFFVYRDFQSRNIMYHAVDFYFIDYQGGRKGNLFYDLVSLLYDSKVNFSAQERDQLKRFYYQLSKPYHGLSPEQFDQFFYATALIRKLQALAAYFLRGQVEGKLAFVLSLPRAIADLKELLTNRQIPVNLSELRQAIDQLSDIYPLKRKRLNISLQINSFSYIFSGYPDDDQGHGGGFVFDCRLLPNPGRLQQYSPLTGLDKPVQQWLEAKPQFQSFMNWVFKIVAKALEEYQHKGYTNLQVNFGCTGGQHRSVYCAERLAQMLRAYYELENLTINHLQLQKRKS